MKTTMLLVLLVFLTGCESSCPKEVTEVRKETFLECVKGGVPKSVGDDFDYGEHIIKACRSASYVIHCSRKNYSNF